MASRIGQLILPLESTMIDLSEDTEFFEEDDGAVDPAQVQRFSEAVLFSTDWTVETIISQLERGNMPSVTLLTRLQRSKACSSTRLSRCS